MRSPVDESDAGGPQDAPAETVPTPVAESAAGASPLADLFGNRPASHAAADADAAGRAFREDLTAFFARIKQPPASAGQPGEGEPLFGGAVDEPPRATTTVMAAAPATTWPVSPGKARPSPRRGMRGALFGSRLRRVVSVAASVVLIAGIVAGAMFGTQLLVHNAQLAEARTDLEAAEAAITVPASALSSAETLYDETALAARGVAEGAATALAAVAGMTDPAAVDAANAALAELVAGLDEGAPATPTAPYEPGDVDTDDVDEVKAAAKGAREYTEALSSATVDVDSAVTELSSKVGALTEAQQTLGASLPATAAIIVAENSLAEKSFRDAVTAAAAAVGTAQAAGGSGDAELLAYAAAVTALRADQQRAVEEKADTRSTTKPRSGATTPGTGNSSTVAPAPQPTPTPEPTPDPPTTPPVTPGP